MPDPLATAKAEEPVSVLVVDDREENRLALRAILAPSGYRIVEAKSGPEALWRLLAEDFAVLLVDVVMPEMSGLELASAIKERERTASLPILFLTAHADDAELIYKGYRVGAVDYLVKPLVPDVVRAKVAVFAELFRQKQRIERQAKLLLESERRETELRLVELKLASERRFRSLADAVPHIIWTADPDGRVDYVNQRWFEYTGMSADATVLTWHTAIHPDDVPACRSAWAQALKMGRALEAECRVRRADECMRWHLLRAVPERGPGGQVEGWLGTFTDIDDQKRAQAVLAEFKGTLDAVLDAVFIFEPATLRFVYVNVGASILLGYSQPELSHMRPIDFSAEHDEARFAALVAALEAPATPRIVLETRFRRKDGREVPVELSLQLVRAGARHVVAIARDVTARKLAELEREQLYHEALDAIRARDEFLSIASHELKTPLSSLKLQIEMLVRSAKAPREEGTDLGSKLDVAARQIDKLARLVGELMDVSRIRAGLLRLAPEDVDLGALAGDVVTRFRQDAAKAGCDVTLTCAEHVRGRWDALRIEQVVTNLLANALKFGAGKPIEIEVERAASEAHLTVRDHGIGISPDDAERIFQRFERAASARSYAGLGLGLYIVRQIVEAHGGTIRVESQPGAGSTFTVTLPPEPPPEAAGTPEGEAKRGREAA